jgi:hypothetical protein
MLRMGNPADSTLITAIMRRYLVNFPRITASIIRRNLPNSMATEKEHLDLKRQGQQSTKPDRLENQTVPRL